MDTIRKLKYGCFVLFMVAMIGGLCTNTYAESKEPVIVDGDSVNYDAASNMITAEGNVNIEYKGVKVTCEKARVNTLTNIGRLQGNVVVEHDEATLTGEDITYNFETRTSELRGMYMESDPFYVYGASVEKELDDKYSLTDACATTCGPLNGPKYFMDYTLNASSLEYYPHRKIVAKNVVMKIGKLPVMYIPYYVQPSKDRLPRVTLIPGHDSDKGMFLLSAWRYYIDEGFRGRIHLDYYAKKGIGTGVTHKYITENSGNGVFKVYYVGDRDKVSFGTNKTHVGGDRYKVQLRHAYSGNDGLQASVQLNKFSDRFFMKDYFQKEYERDTNPLSYGLVNKSFSGSSLSLLAQKRVNSFSSQLEYLPRLKYDVFKKRVGESDFYFESESQVAQLAYQYAKPTDEDYDITRVDSYNKISYQRKFGWLNVNPYVGLRETYFSRNRNKKEDLDRTVFSTGLELSTKMYKMFDNDFKIASIDVDAVKHIVTPILRYGYVHEPTVSNSQLYQFDSIDSASRADSMSFTLENKFKAKGTDIDGNEKVWDLLYFAPTVGYSFNQPGRGSHPTNVSYRLEIKPWEHLYFQQEAKHNIDQTERMEEVISDVNFESELVELSFGHRYLRDEESQYTNDIKWNFADKWSIQTYLRYDDNLSKFEKQGFYLVRELNCWDVELGLTIDQDYKKTLWLLFTLKAFPEMGFDVKQSYSGPKQDAVK